MSFSQNLPCVFHSTMMVYVVSPVVVLLLEMFLFRPLLVLRRPLLLLLLVVFLLLLLLRRLHNIFASCCSSVHRQMVVLDHVRQYYYLQSVLFEYRFVLLKYYEQKGCHLLMHFVCVQHFLVEVHERRLLLSPLLLRSLFFVLLEYQIHYYEANRRFQADGALMVHATHVVEARYPANWRPVGLLAILGLE